MTHRGELEHRPMLYFTNHYVQPVKNVLQTMGEDFSAKALIATLAAIVDIFLLDHAIPLLALIFLLAVDTATGVAKSVKNGTFTSANFRHSGIKVTCYLALITSAHVSGLLSPQIAALHADYWLTMYFGVTEVLSIGENVEELTGIKLPTRFLNLLKKILLRGS